jgi:hypothetical protein
MRMARRKCEQKFIVLLALLANLLFAAETENTI